MKHFECKTLNKYKITNLKKEKTKNLLAGGGDQPATEEEWVQSWRMGTPGQCASQLPESHISPPHGHHCTDLFHSPHSPYRQVLALLQYPRIPTPSLTSVSVLSFEKMIAELSSSDVSFIIVSVVVNSELAGTEVNHS